MFSHNIEKKSKLSNTRSENNSFIETNVSTVISKCTLYTSIICQSLQSDNKFLQRINNAMEEMTIDDNDMIEEESEPSVRKTPRRRYINDKNVINMISDFTLD